MKVPVSTGRSPREQELLDQGWTKRFLASGSRLQETAELYKSTGLEVHFEPARAEDLACSECQSQQPPSTIEGWYVIYTRPRQEAEDACAQEEELW
ncbi:MAG: hypothetical protein HY694_05435 [Deltaproteobacteria bacterium]|nr:hypothetical protein [Deltaproteobacteria bacterium]